MKSYILLYLTMLSFIVRGQEPENKSWLCHPGNYPFKAGESITYKIFYNWKFVWVEAGEVTFSVDTTKIFNKKAFYFKGEGHTYKKWDWFFKVRDKYEAWADMESLRPYRFKRVVNEGTYYLYEDCLFDYKRNKIYCFWSRKAGELNKDTLDMQSCVFDVLSLIYLARTVDFSNMQPDEYTWLKVFVDRAIFETYMRFIGTGEIPDRKEKDRAFIFRAKLILGTMFKEGEKMQVWIGDTQKKIPEYIESEILVGYIKAIRIK